MPRVRLLPIAGLAAALAGCSREPFAAPQLPLLAISDGAHSGNAHFYFLPPLVPPPSFSGAFDGSLSPIVRITENGVLLADLVPTVNVVDEQYQSNWHTNEFTLVAEKDYRISVRVGATELGFADVEVVSSGRELRNVDTGEYIPLLDGQTLPIKFRIEEGALSCPSVDEWTAVASGTTGWLFRVWGTSASNVYAVGMDGTILRYDGTGWHSEASIPTAGLYDIWGSSPSDVYAVGANGTLIHFDGATWTAIPTGLTEWLFGVWGASENEVFVTGQNGTILHYDGSAWTAMSSGTTTTLTGIWGASASNVYVVGDGGTILHFDGATWSPMSSGTSQILRAISGSSQSDILAVGTGGTVLRFDGSAWSAMSSGTSAFLYGVLNRSPSDGYAVGGGGTILRFDGTSWSSMASGTSEDLYGVGTAGACHIYVVGQSGTLLRGSFAGNTGPNFALDFNQSYVNVPDNNALDLTTSWTLEAWVYPRASGNGSDQDIISKWDGAADASYIMQIDRTGVLRVVTNNGSTQTIGLSNALLTNNTWHHVAATFEGTNLTGTLKLYVDGVFDKTISNALTPINSTQPLAFGREGNYSGGTLNGIIDDARLWNIVRTDAEIANNRTVRLAGTESGLVGLWRFDEGSGDVAFDSSGRGNHGRLGTTVGTDAWDPQWTTNSSPIL